MAIATFRIGDPRKTSEGLRLGTVRFLPRGVAKKDYGRLDYFDVWMPALAPSRKLLSSYGDRLRAGSTAAVRNQFFARFRRELLASSDTRQTLIALAELGRKTDFCVGCYCEHEENCHRWELARLLKMAAAGKLPR